jgi:hypothetical protein
MVRRAMRVDPMVATGATLSLSASLDNQLLSCPRIDCAGGIVSARWASPNNSPLANSPASRPEIADQKPDILAVFPRTKALVSFLLRMNRENIRTPARSIANLEFNRRCPLGCICNRCHGPSRCNLCLGT